MGKLLERRMKKSSLPPLHDGDELSVDEFLRRYQASPEGFHAELLDGIVHVNSFEITNPDGTVTHTMMTAAKFHSQPHFLMTTLLGVYAHRTPGVQGMMPVSLVLPTGRSVPEPDILLCIDPDAGGGTHPGKLDCVYGIPELLVEIANTSAAKDLGQKKALYLRNRIPEYFVWRTRLAELYWFVLQDKEFVLQEPDKDGQLKSRIFPGLWLHAKSVLAGDINAALRTLELGLASPEHAKFVEKLRKAKAKKKK